MIKQKSYLQFHLGKRIKVRYPHKKKMTINKLLLIIIVQSMTLFKKKATNQKLNF